MPLVGRTFPKDHPIFFPSPVLAKGEVLVVEKSRYTLPGHYCDMATFKTAEEAVQAGRAAIHPIAGCPGKYTRSFVDRRDYIQAAPGSGSIGVDTVGARVELFHDGSWKIDSVRSPL